MTLKGLSLLLGEGSKLGREKSTLMMIPYLLTSALIWQNTNIRVQRGVPKSTIPPPSVDRNFGLTFPLSKPRPTPVRTYLAHVCIHTCALAINSDEQIHDILKAEKGKREIETDKKVQLKLKSWDEKCESYRLDLSLARGYFMHKYVQHMPIAMCYRVYLLCKCKALFSTLIMRCTTTWK